MHSCLQVALDLAHQLCIKHRVFERPLGLMGVWGGIVREWLHTLLPYDAASRYGQCSFPISSLCRICLYSLAMHLCVQLALALCNAHAVDLTLLCPLCRAVRRCSGRVRVVITTLPLFQREVVTSFKVRQIHCRPHESLCTVGRLQHHEQ